MLPAILKEYMKPIKPQLPTIGINRKAHLCSVRVNPAAQVNRLGLSSSALVYRLLAAHHVTPVLAEVELAQVMVLQLTDLRESVVVVPVMPFAMLLL